MTEYDRIQEADEQLVRRLGWLVPLWVLLILVASLALVGYGDVLMSVFT